jgi:hypothetical protein
MEPGAATAAEHEHLEPPGLRLSSENEMGAKTRVSFASIWHRWGREASLSLEGVKFATLWLDGHSVAGGVQAIFVVVFLRPGRQAKSETNGRGCGWPNLVWVSSENRARRYPVGCRLSHS